MAELYDAVAAEKKVALDVIGGGAVTADVALLRRAIGNLLSNAIRHTPEGGRVTLEAAAKGQGCSIRVRDTGEGLDHHELTTLFKRFSRSRRSQALNPQGLGLGLAIVKSIVDLHGGTVEVTSTPGEGTQVTLFFPAR